MNNTEETKNSYENLSDTELESKIRETEEKMSEKVTALNKKGGDDDQELKNLISVFFDLINVQEKRGKNEETYQERINKYREMCRT